MCVHSYQPLGTDIMLLLTDHDSFDIIHFSIHRTASLKMKPPSQASLHQSQAWPNAQTCASSLSSHFAASDSLRRSCKLALRHCKCPAGVRGNCYTATLTKKLTNWEPSTQASFKAVCRKFIEWCENDKLNALVYKFLAHPAIEVVAFLESERRRHIQQGTQPSSNVAIAFGKLDKLSMMQGCLDKAEIDRKKAVVARAKNDSVQQDRSAVF